MVRVDSDHPVSFDARLGVEMSVVKHDFGQISGPERTDHTNWMTDLGVSPCISHHEDSDNAANASP